MTARTPDFTLRDKHPIAFKRAQQLANQRNSPVTMIVQASGVTMVYGVVSGGHVVHPATGQD